MFDFVPKIVIVSEAGSQDVDAGIGVFVYNVGGSIITGAQKRANVTWKDNTIKWYTYSGASFQLNTRISTYGYVAIV